MRTAMLAIVATIGAAMLTGPAKATTLMDTPTVKSIYQTVVSTAGCPAGWRWDPSHYNRWSVWYPAHCIRD